MEAKRSYVQEGNQWPTKEELARHVGMTVDKLEKLLFTTRMPLSMQQPVWADQDTTFEVNAFSYLNFHMTSTFSSLKEKRPKGKGHWTSVNIWNYLTCYIVLFEITLFDL